MVEKAVCLMAVGGERERQTDRGKEGGTGRERGNGVTPLMT
jgi:hypothetical protein